MITMQRLGNGFTERQICFDSLSVMRIWQKYRLYSSFNFIKKKGLKFTKDSQPITVVCKECLLFYDIDKGDSTRRHFIGKGTIFLKNIFLFINILIFSQNKHWKMNNIHHNIIKRMIKMICQQNQQWNKKCILFYKHIKTIK